jgi:hypothetical protein
MSLKTCCSLSAEVGALSRKSSEQDVIIVAKMNGINHFMFFIVFIEVDF